MTKLLRDIIFRNRSGEKVAIPSVCSAQPDVIRASLLRAQTLNQPIVIEATSNQVNQDGGYTGMRPQDFLTFVHKIAREAGVDRERIEFGGDHLGPQAWRSESPESSMAKAHKLVEAYVQAGFKKIHLDCSEGSLGEPAQLDDTVTAERSAQLARTCLDAAKDQNDLLFVIGTEVPPPGGARADESGDIVATTPDAARATLAAHADSFGDMKPLIGGLVVQPGLEFSPMQVDHLPMERDPKLLATLGDWPNVCLEAHSTDYQRPEAFPRLAELGFAFQKVGPVLTFVYRQALYSLDIIRGLSDNGERNLMDVMEKTMVDDAAYWQNHYHGDHDELKLQRHFGLADRIRYYWPKQDATEAVKKLKSDLDYTIPDPILWQVFGQEILDRAENLEGSQVERLITAQIQIALDPYFFNPSVEGAK